MSAGLAAGLEPCVHCGFCLQSCPTYLVTADEADSPRGRIVLIRGLAEGRLDPRDPVLASHLDRCLGCRACEPVCPSGVSYGPALERTRHLLTEARPVPLSVRLVHSIMAERGLGRVLFPLARMMRPAARLLAGRSRLGFPLGMLAATRPSGVARGNGGAQQASRAEPAVAATPAGTAVVLRGCVMDGLFSHVHRATERTLRANGFTVVETDAQGCCGALHAHAGQHEEARELARRNVRAFAAADGATVVADAAGCGAMLKEYGRLLEGDPLEQEAHALAARVRDVTEVLAGSGPRRGAPLELRVAYDPPCHLLHAQGVAAEPEALLAAVPGLKRVRHAGAELCCGSAGSYSLAQPALSHEVLGHKIDALVAARPDVVATGNPGCQMQIGAGLLAAGVKIPVVHPVELLDWSYRKAGYYAD